MRYVGDKSNEHTVILVAKSILFCPTNAIEIQREQNLLSRSVQSAHLSGYVLFYLVNVYGDSSTARTQSMRRDRTLNQNQIVRFFSQTNAHHTHTHPHTYRQTCTLISARTPRDNKIATTDFLSREKYKARFAVKERTYACRGEREKRERKMKQSGLVGTIEEWKLNSSQRF